MRSLPLTSLALAVALASASPALAAPARTAPHAARAATSAFDRASLDTTCAPCRDFDQYVNGGWKATHQIPAAYSSYGSFQELQDRNLDVLHAILDRAAANTSAAPGSPTGMLGTYYSTCMDSAAAEAAGLQPVQPLLAAIDGMASKADLAGEVAWLHAHGIRGGVFQFAGQQDLKNSSMVIANIGQGGLGLPERDYYFRPDSSGKATRAEYVAHITRAFQLMGRTEADARSAGDRILALETALAKPSLNAVQRRDPEANYHKLPLDSLIAMAPSFDWRKYFAGRGVSFDSLNVAHPAFFRALEGTLGATPLTDWQDYLRWRVIDDAAPTLTRAFAEEDFRYNRIFSGAKEMQPRWKRCLRATDGDLGDLLGQEFVKERFSPAARERALHMVRNLEAALADRLVALDWMSDATKQAARTKLDAFANKIGYPDKWRDYGAVKLSRASYFGNHLAARTAEVARQSAKIGKPVDRGEWMMTAPTVNAFYSPQLNSINFPAGILQPPFYDPSWDDATNYGGIGSVIGHEMTHGFDDQGRKFDPAGNLRDWWTPADAANYKTRSQKVSEQFDGYTVIDTLHVNGRLTLGENTADLGGLALAYAALQKELAAKGRPANLDGFTPEQRFFLSYGRIWRRLERDEALRLQVLTNPHAPGHWRVNGPLSNLDEFAKAFGCQPGDAMVRRDEVRARIW